MIKCVFALVLAVAGCATADSRPDGGVERSDGALLPDAGVPGDAVADAEPRGTVDPVINEFVADHAGGDACEYVEIAGTPGADYSRFTLLTVEGDAGNNPGEVQAVIPVESTSSENGLWVSGFLADQLQNGSITLLLVADYAGGPNDVDGDNDGTIDNQPWAALVDAVAIDDGDSSDATYAETAVLAESFDGGTVQVGGASRIPDATDTNEPDDWVRNLNNAAGLTCESGSASVGEAQNTPGQPNHL